MNKKQRQALSSLILAGGFSLVCGIVFASEIVELDTGTKIIAERVEPVKGFYNIYLPTLPNEPLKLPAADVKCRNPTSWCIAQAVPPQAPEPVPDRIEIHGSNTIGEQLMPDLISQYFRTKGYSDDSIVKEALSSEDQKIYLNANDKNELKVEVFAHGSNTGKDPMLQHRAAIWMRSSPMPKDMNEELKKAGFPDFYGIESEHVLALDGLAVIVNRENLVGALSTKQIAEIFSGKILDWKEIGGRPGAINLYRRDDKSGTTDTFNSLVMGPEKEKINFAAKAFSDSEKLVGEVASDPNGIGYVGYSFAGERVRSLGIISSCGVPIRPSRFSIKTTEYPLTRRLFLYTNGNPSEALARNLLKFSLSNEAFETIDKAGYVSRSVEMESFDNQVSRVLQVALGRNPAPDDTRAFFYDVQALKRLSATVRFKAGTTELDLQSEQELDRLAKFLSNESYRTHRFVVAGFTSEKEAAPAELQRLSQRRASQVALALRNRGAMLFSENTYARGYTSGAPINCGGTAAETEANQRVEIWVD